MLPGMTSWVAMWKRSVAASSIAHPPESTAACLLPIQPPNTIALCYIARSRSWSRKKCRKDKNIVPESHQALYIALSLEVEPQKELIANGEPERIFWHANICRIATVLVSV